MSIILLVIQRDSEYYVVSELSKGYTQENRVKSESKTSEELDKSSSILNISFSLGNDSKRARLNALLTAHH